MLLEHVSEVVDIASEGSVQVSPFGVDGTLLGLVVDQFLSSFSDGLGGFGLGSSDLFSGHFQFTFDGGEFLSGFLGKSGMAGSDLVQFSVELSDGFGGLGLGGGQFFSPFGRGESEDSDSGFPPVEEVVGVGQVAGDSARGSPAPTLDGPASP